MKKYLLVAALPLLCWCSQPAAAQDYEARWSKTVTVLEKHDQRIQQLEAELRDARSRLALMESRYGSSGPSYQPAASTDGYRSTPPPSSPYTTVSNSPPLSSPPSSPSYAPVSYSPPHGRSYEQPPYAYGGGSYGSYHAYPQAQYASHPGSGYYGYPGGGYSSYAGYPPGYGYQSPPYSYGYPGGTVQVIYVITVDPSPYRGGDTSPSYRVASR